MITYLEATGEDIEKIAQRVREIGAIKNRGRFKDVREFLMKTVEGFGGRVLSPGGHQQSPCGGAALVIDDKGNFQIWLPNDSSHMQDNFNIAHELAHFVIHYKHEPKQGTGPVVFHRYGPDEWEWQANRFAAALLMPAEELKEEYQQVEGNLSRLAGYFEVPVDVVEVRAESMGLKR